MMLSSCLSTHEVEPRLAVDKVQEEGREDQPDFLGTPVSNVKHLLNGQLCIKIPHIIVTSTYCYKACSNANGCLRYLICYCHGAEHKPEGDEPLLKVDSGVGVGASYSSPDSVAPREERRQEPRRELERGHDEQASK